MPTLIQMYSDFIKAILVMNPTEYLCFATILVCMVLATINIANTFNELAKEAYKVCKEIKGILKNTQGYAPVYITHTAKKFIWLLAGYIIQTVKLIIIFPFWLVDQEWGVTLALATLIYEAYECVRKGL
jgi:hypothetical protein